MAGCEATEVVFAFFIMKTIIYIDGFNLYYGCLKDSPYKWLNVLKS